VKLIANRYGKSRVRIMKVLREGDGEGAVHTVKELTARVLLEGDFARSYIAADNAGVVATDTMKNTLYVLAHEHLGEENEPFARVIARHFLDRHAHVSQVTVELDERVWTRMHIGAGGGAGGGAGAAYPDPHPHAFQQRDVARPFTRLVASRETATHESGIRELILLKSTASGFEGFDRDELTTLPETRERILASAVKATWLWASDRAPASYRAARETIVEALLAPFAQRYSPSVQATLFEMGTAALEACPDIARIMLMMPNLHCLPVDLARFGRVNRHEIFVPTDEPHGDIEATVSR
jgi:urate oxidase